MKILNEALVNDKNIKMWKKICKKKKYKDIHTTKKKSSNLIDDKGIY